MKKLAKSILCLVLALMLVFSFAACDSSDKDSKDKEETTKAAAVEEKDDELDLDGAEEAVEDIISDSETLLEATGAGAMLESMLGVSVDELSDEEAQLYESLIDIILNVIDIEVVDSELVDDTTAEVTVEITCPDFEGMDIDSYLTEENLLAAFEELGYTEEDLANVTDEEEQMALTIDAIGVIIEMMADDAEVIVEEDVFEVEYEDGEWVVVA